MFRQLVLTGPLVLIGCGTLDDSGKTTLPSGLAVGTPVGTPTGTATGSTTSCDLGLACNPIPVSSFPFVDNRSTVDAPGSEVDAYACAPDTDESGPEWFYAITVPERGILSMRVDDVSGDAIDVDVHLMADTDPASCWNRDNIATAWVVDAGTWIGTVDTWVNGSGEVQSGAYELTVDFVPMASGRCATVPTDVRMFWDDCAPGIDCEVMTHTDSQDYPFLHTPSVGPVVKEAHLVTTAESFPGNGWPTSFTDGIDNHYAVTEAASGYVMDHTEPWAPSGEGGSEFGQGSTGAPIPPEHETWYVNMYWRDRPAQGHRMILINPLTGAAVVAAAGYETGPGANTAIGGASEEIHDVLGTVHRDDVVMAFAADQSPALRADRLRGPVSLVGLVMLVTAVVIGLVGIPLWLEKVPPNWFYGFRTPRTLADEAVWYPVNKIGGRDLMLAGVVGAIAVVLTDLAMVDPVQSAMWIMAALMVPMTIAVLHSFWAASSFVADHDAFLEEGGKQSEPARRRPQRQSESER